VKLNDTVWGGLLLALAFAVLWNIQGFPKIPGQNIGPGAFPGVLASLLAVCAVMLMVKGLRARRAEGLPWVQWGEWLGSRRHVVSFVLTAASLVFYVLVVNGLGFIVTGTVILLTLFLQLRVKPWLAVLVAVVATVVIHAVFYKLLRVSLPWGVLPILY
jgi:putative tricarboxylic transport membrane protein